MLGTEQWLHAGLRDDEFSFLVFSHEDDEPLRILAEILEHGALPGFVPLVVEGFPLLLVPDLLVLDAGIEDLEVAVSYEPRGVEPMGAQDDGIARKHLIEFRDDFKFIFADGPYLPEGLHMEEVVGDLDDEEPGDDDPGPFLRDGLKIVLLEHDRGGEDHEDIEEYEHPIVEEETEGRPHEPDDESEERKINRSLFDLVHQPGDQEDEIGSCEEEEVPGGEEGARFGASQRGRDDR